MQPSVGASQDSPLPTVAVPETTRIFVSGLPPTFTSDQLASHFGSRFKVTDAHVLADRRIGFVGFGDSTVAQDAAKHFNKTYIRMSKIAVDLARPIEVSRNSTGNSLPVSQRRPTQETRDLDRKRKRSQEDDGEALRVQKTMSKPHEKQGAESDHETRAAVEEEDDTEAAQPATTDNDWLRGRTTRTLDLLDPDEVQIHQDDEAEVPKLVKGNTTDVDVVAGPVQEEPHTTKVPNARLFLRNLAFSVTEDDLRQLFDEFGKVQEVSNFPLLHTPIDMMIS